MDYEEANIHHEMILPYNRLRDEAIKEIGGKYVTYGMLIVDEGSMKIIVGSTALQYFNLNRRKPLDVD